MPEIPSLHYTHALQQDLKLYAVLAEESGPKFHRVICMALYSIIAKQDMGQAFETKVPQGLIAMDHVPNRKSIYMSIMPAESFGGFLGYQTGEPDAADKLRWNGMSAARVAEIAEAVAESKRSKIIAPNHKISIVSDAQLNG